MFDTQKMDNPSDRNIESLTCANRRGSTYKEVDIESSEKNCEIPRENEGTEAAIKG